MDKLMIRDRYEELVASGGSGSRMCMLDALKRAGVWYDDAVRAIVEGLGAEVVTREGIMPDHRVRLMAAEMLLEHLMPPEEKGVEVEDFMKEALERIERLVGGRRVEGLVIVGDGN